MAYEDIDTLSRMQAGQSRQVGAAAADLADPFATERGRYKGALRNFMDNPSGSPAYKFAYEQGLDAINRRAAATGKTGSGNYLADLMRFGQGLASQDYYKQGNFLARLAGVDSSSPAAAALSLTGGFNRGQDQESIGAVARALRSNQPQNQLQPQNWMQQMNSGGQRTGNTTGLPTGGITPSASYSSGGTFGDVRSMSPTQLNAEASLLGLPTIPYQPGFGLPGQPQSGNTGFSYNPNQGYDIPAAYSPFTGSGYLPDSGNIFGMPSGGDMGAGYGWDTPSDMSYDYGGYDTGGYQDYGADYYSGGEEY